jgi:hypothetical protein
MIEDLLLSVHRMFREALQGAALVTVIALCCGALSVAKSRAPDADRPSAVLEWEVEPQWRGTVVEVTPIKFRRDEPSDHLWVARIASLEVRLEWGSGHGRNVWSITILDIEGKRVAHAEATAETGKCI